MMTTDAHEPAPDGGGGIDRRRWIAKKLARRGVAWLGSALALAATRPRVRVLTYHRFGQVPRDPFCLPREHFEQQVRWLAERRRAISLEELGAFLAGERELPDGAVLVTIDDGHRSTFHEALPVLRDHAVPAVAFVSAGLVGDEDAAREAPEPYMSWDELAALPEGGVAVGSHAMSHRSLGGLSPDQVRVEASDSRQLLEERTGRTVDAFAYPFGTRADFGPGTGRALREAGYRWAFTSQHGAIAPGLDPIELPRIKIEAGEGLGMFRAACGGAMDAWRALDWALWRLQQARTETLVGR